MNRIYVILKFMLRVKTECRSSMMQFVGVYGRNMLHVTWEKNYEDPFLMTACHINYVIEMDRLQF